MRIILEAKLSIQGFFFFLITARFVVWGITHVFSPTK